MPLPVIPSFLYYCLLMGITPGPANVTSLATAARLGRSRAVRQWYGIFAGFFVVSMVSAVLLYLVGTVVTEYVRYFTYVGAAYILYLALHILLDRGSDVAADGEPPVHRRGLPFAEGTFLYGFFLQLTNVKIMVTCVSALAGFVLPYGQGLTRLLLFGALLPFISGPMCNLLWVFLGGVLQRLFRNHRKAVNLIMALSLGACAISMVL